ncbi:MAG: MFS transporter [Anaerolineae bacterium]
MTSTPTTSSAAPTLAHPRSLSILLIAYFAFVCIAIPDGLLNIAWTYMKTDFNVQLESLGLLLTVAMVGRLLTSFASGVYIRRLGMSGFLIGGSVMLAVGVIGYALAPSWIVLLVVVAITAMGAGAIDAGLNTFISAYYTRGQLNWLHAAYGVGVTFGPILATFVIVTLSQSWRVSYWLALIPLALLVVLVFFTLSRWHFTPADQSKASDAHPANAPSLIESLRLPVVILSGLLFFAYGGVEIGVGQLSNTLFVEGRQVAQETASFWISLYWASFTIGRILMGFIADRVNVEVLLRACMIGALIGAGMLLTNLTPFLGFLGVAVMGFAFAPLFATLISETPLRVGERHAANTVGIQVGVVGLGGAALPYLAGLLVHSAGLEVIGVLLFGGCLTVFAIHEIVLRVAN